MGFLKRAAGKVFARMGDKLLEYVLDFPVSFHHHASIYQFPNAVLCEDCLKGNEHGAVCVMSGGPIVALKEINRVTLPDWWVKYYDVKDLQSAERGGVGSIEIYVMDSNSTVPCNKLCPAVGVSCDIEYLPYSQVTKEEFIDVFHEELHKAAGYEPRHESKADPSKADSSISQM